jgi:hypothetical protein
VSGVRYARLKRLLGPQRTVRLRLAIRGLGVPRWGNLRRTMPFSLDWGFDRGSPIDRYYLDQFLDAHRDVIRGRVLEIQAPIYTERYGHDVVESRSVDIDPVHRPSFLCDLSRSEDVIPSDHFDCFLMPNTLSVLRDVEGCLRHALRVVRPGGHILAAASTFVPFVRDVAREGEDYWHLSAAGWREVTKKAWPTGEPTIEAHGNCLAAVAAMLGLAHEELTPEELDVFDAPYPVLVTIALQKPA